MTNQSSDSTTTVGMALPHFSFWPWMRQGHKLMMGIGNLTKQRPLERACQGSVRNSTIESSWVPQWLFLCAWDPGKQHPYHGHLWALWVPCGWYKAWSLSWLNLIPLKGILSGVVYFSQRLDSKRDVHLSAIGHCRATALSESGFRILKRKVFSHSIPPVSTQCHM